MPSQFADHIQSKDGFDGGVMKDVQSEEAQEEVSGYLIGFHYRHTIII